MSSSTWSSISRSVRAPVRSRMRSASVDLPWSIWAMMEKLRIRSGRMSAGTLTSGRAGQYSLRPERPFPGLSADPCIHARQKPWLDSSPPRAASHDHGPSNHHPGERPAGKGPRPRLRGLTAAAPRSRTTHRARSRTIFKALGPFLRATRPVRGTTGQGRSPRRGAVSPGLTWSHSEQAIARNPAGDVSRGRHGACSISRWKSGPAPGEARGAVRAWRRGRR